MEGFQLNNQTTDIFDPLQDNIEMLIGHCEVATPIDVWMSYLATLPACTTNEELDKLQSRFMPAIREYLGEIGTN
jgi:hypothetical protein